MEEVEAKKKKNGERWLFSQIVVISRFTKTPDSYPANSLKKNTQVFLLPWGEKYKKSTVKYLNLECDNVGLEWKIMI